MKQKLLLLLLLLCICFEVNAQNSYYYYKGRKINLVVDTNNLNIITDNVFQKESIPGLTIRETIEKRNNIKQQNEKILKLELKAEMGKLGYWQIVDTLKQNSNVKNICPYFERTNGTSIGISNVFYVKIKDVTDTVLLQKFAKQKDVDIIKQVPYMPLWYILSLTNFTKGNAIEISNEFYESGYFADTDPAFMFEFKSTCTNDPSFGELWGLSNNMYGADINICNAWEITKGEGIKVAVVDKGIDVYHGDLAANIDPLSFDAESGTSPSIFNGSIHGTHVAGIIAAVGDNELQVVGVAPEAKIMGVSHSFTVTSTIAAELASGISWAWDDAGADVINNSWGDYAGLYPELHSSILEDAIINALTKGREGKGCVVVFAAGNTAPNMNYPAYFHEDIMAVGSIRHYGIRDGGSSYGNELDFVAPGNSIYSTLPYNQIGPISGTSMAAPHVSGIAALILSVDPNLTQRQVGDIIESTAKKVRTEQYTYQVETGRPNGTWHEEMGYGLVDAYEAVLAVCQIDLVDQNITTDATITACKINVQNVNVLDDAKLTLESTADTIAINALFEVVLGSELEIKMAVGVGIIPHPGGGLNGSGTIQGDPEGTWMLYKMEGETIWDNEIWNEFFVENVPVNEWFTLTIEDTQLSGRSGCSRFTGNFAPANSSLIFTGVLSNLVGCLPQIQNLEHLYVDFVRRATYMYVSGDTMYLYIDNDCVLEFYRQWE